MPEPISPRELEILGLISEGLSNREIAHRLYLSIETVKWYNKQLFSKLGVRSRTQAVSVARQHFLLDNGTASFIEQTHPQQNTSLQLAQSKTLRVPPFLLHASDETPSPFVARQHELRLLKTRLDHTLAGHTNFILVSGEAGRGKTSLLTEFARQAQLDQADLIVVGGSCTAHTGVGDPYLPFRDVLGLLSGDLEARWAAGAILQEQAHRLWAFLPNTIQALIEHGPSLLDVLVSSEALVRRISPYVSNSADWWAELLALTKQNPLRTVQLEQHQLFEQVTQVFRNLSASQPLLIHFDDLQWADSASLSLLFHLGRRLANNRIMVVGAYRSSEVTDSHPLTPLISEFKRRFGDIQIDLEKYDPLEGQKFVDDFLDTEPNCFDKQFREQFFWYTKGHPLFTIELLRHLQECGNLAQDSHGRWIEKTAIDSGDLPVRVEAVIQQRISQLDPNWQELLSIASVEGEVFTAQVLARIQQIDEHLVLRLLSEMEHHNNLVREHSEIQVGERYLNRYQFNHFLFQQYLYQKLSRGERRLQHRSLAEALEYFYQGQTNEIAVQLAYHFTEAGAQAKATIYALIAGDRARKKVAIEEAIQFYRDALAELPIESDQERAETLKKLGECLWLIGQLPEALEAYESSYHIFESLADRIGAGSTQRQIGDIYWELSQREKS
ncbi:MAG TPA: AAA family ATPase, partial [Anaerolineales bacterium]|nr:AAA family ATPase [Anaerolineales bacterium]